MVKIKSHKSVEQIAKKHRLDVSFIENQLKMGEPIEHEHTKDHNLAMDIALQHLDEIPDYYTRLKKMEASAKKEHRRSFKDIKEYFDDVDSATYPKKSVHLELDKRYCPKCKKVELRSKCKYGPRYWDIFSVPAKLKESVMEPKKNLVNNILDDLKEDKPCWKKYVQVGMKNKDGKEVPNCVPKKGVKKSIGYKKEDVSIQDANGNTFAEIIDIIKPEPIKGFKSQIEETSRMQSQTGNVVAVTLLWRGKYYSLKIFFPDVRLPSRKEINDELQKVYPGCRVVHHAVSEFTSGEPLIQTCGFQGGSSARPGPSKNYVKTMGEGVAAWQRKEGKNKSGGLNEPGRKSYEAENPGSDLKAPSKEVGNPRRASFCARMSGMKKKLTSAKTARDPDSRINKSLRAWNC
jgi:hypothetical protein